MAKLSRLSRQLRRAFERESPAAQLDDETVDFLAGMLEDEAEEDELAEIWSLHVLEHASAAFGSEGAARGACRAVLRWVRDTALSETDSRSGSPAGLSRASSLGQPHLPAPAISAAAAVAPVAAQGLEPSRGSAMEVWGLMEWLRRLNLDHYVGKARAWCAELGAADVEEVIENWQDFCEELSLKPLEKRRVQRDCEGTTGSHGAAAAAPGDSPAASAAHADTDAAGAGRGAESADGACRPSAPRSGDAALGASAGTSAPSAAAPSAPPARPIAWGGAAYRRQPAGPLQPEGAPAAIPAPQKRAHRIGSFGPEDNPYTILHEVGSGVTATVYKCQRDGQVFAAKAITLSRLRLQRDFAAVLERLHRESEILFSMHHPQIVTLHDVCETPEKMYLVMEFVDGGELHQHIVDNRGGLPEHEARYIFLQIVLGLRYIHSQGVLHRDLKPQNILIDKSASRNGLLQVKISDFGHSKLVNDGYSTALTQVGTPRYWAPEVATTSGHGYDYRVDLWSLGVVLYVMLEGRYPFDSCDDAKLRLTSESKLSPQAQDLVKGLIQWKPQERVTLEQCLNHPWVMLADGPLSKVVLRCEEVERKRDKRELRATLTREPQDVKRLRRDLQALNIHLKASARLRRRQGVREVAVVFGPDVTDARVEAAWKELTQILARHFPREKFQRLDTLSSSAVPSPLPLVEEVEELPRDHSARSFGEESSAAALEAQDAELRELQARSYPGWTINAAVGECAPVPRQVEFCLQGGAQLLEFCLQLPPGDPEGDEEALELVSLKLHSNAWDRESPGGSCTPCGERAVSEQEVRQTLLRFLEEAKAEGLGLQEFAGRLCKQQDILSLAVACDGGGGSSCSSAAAGPRPALPEASPPALAERGNKEQVRCARVRLLCKHHDEKDDQSEYAPRGSVRKRVSFFEHVRSTADITGFLSFGKPGVLVVEGPDVAVEKFLQEVKKFASWRFGIEEGPTRHTMVADIAAWRVFNDFSKMRTEDVRECFEKLGQDKLYDDLFAGTQMDMRKRSTKARHK